jgi:PhnB protein
MKINPYLNFNRQCAAAFKFYQQVLGGEIVMLMKQGDSPMAEHVPKESHDLIMHARLVIGENVLMGSDAPPERFERTQGIAVTINVDSIAEADRIYRGLSEGGSITLELQQTFWAVRFAMFTDRFGTPWMINCEQDS